MEPSEVFPPFKDIQEENGKILHYMEQHTQLNQKMIQNVMQLKNQVQKVTSMEIREGEESLNRGIPNRYCYSMDRNVSPRREHSPYHSVGIHHGNVKFEIHHKRSPKSQQKRKRDENVLQGELRKLKSPTFDGENSEEVIEMWFKR